MMINQCFSWSWCCLRHSISGRLGGQPSGSRSQWGRSVCASVPRIQVSCPWSLSAWGESRLGSYRIPDSSWVFGRLCYEGMIWRFFQWPVSSRLVLMAGWWFLRRWRGCCSRSGLEASCLLTNWCLLEPVHFHLKSKNFYLCWEPSEIPEFQELWSFSRWSIDSWSRLRDTWCLWMLEDFQRICPQIFPSSLLS